MAVVDAADPENNIFLRPRNTEGVVNRLSSGDFLLLASHRQAGKTTLGQELKAQLEQLGCKVVVVWLTILRGLSGYDAVFTSILESLGVQPDRNMSSSSMQLQIYMQQPSAPKLIVIFEESDAIDRLQFDEQVNFMQELRVLKQLPGR